MSSRPLAKEPFPSVESLGRLSIVTVGYSVDAAGKPRCLVAAKMDSRDVPGFLQALKRLDEPAEPEFVDDDPPRRVPTTAELLEQEKRLALAFSQAAEERANA